MVVCVSYGGLSVDASVGFSQSLDDLQSIKQLVRAFNPQQLLPAQTLPVLHTNTKQAQLFRRLTSKNTAQESKKIDLFPLLSVRLLKWCQNVKVIKL